jgi:membrane protein implicated in regulation of membrane protease activity
LEEFIGRQARAVDDFKDGSGKVEFKGTRWSARCEEAPVKKGEWVTIQSKDSLILNVTPS